MPSDPSRKVFKAKSIIKQRVVRKNQKPIQNKENTMINAQDRKEAKLIKKPKSLIPKPSNRLSNLKNLRKGEYQKYIEENKDRENMIPTGLSSRKSSLATSVSKQGKKAPINKTEMLYQKARMALGKNKKSQGELILIIQISFVTDKL
jgi:hypothetical protein